ncbi:MAG: 3-oxoadipate enol-lactonase [Cypionkella sp.]|nr:3-oxoadipate enol-lactonase [Cypionkella sp.]
MQDLSRSFGALHVQISGPVGAPAVVFANSLGTDLRLWDAVLPLMPAGLRLLRYDKRGHGLSDVDAESCDIADHIDDAIAVISAFAQGPVVFVGLSIGGLIAQGVAHRRPDLVRALVLSNTAARLGTAQSWADRIAAVQTGGCGAIADAVMQRWFGAEFLANPALPLWRNMLGRTSAEGYLAACHALSAADLRAQTAQITLPTLVISGEVDGASPPALVKDTADLIKGAQYQCIPNAGHLPCVEAPEKWAALVIPFLKAHLNV